MKNNRFNATYVRSNTGFGSACENVNDALNQVRAQLIVDYASNPNAINTLDMIKFEYYLDDKLSMTIITDVSIFEWLKISSI